MAKGIKLRVGPSNMSGLTVRQGRLINERPDSIPAITEAAIMRKARIRQEQIGMMEEAYVRAEMRMEAREEMMGENDDD